VYRFPGEISSANGAPRATRHAKNDTSVQYWFRYCLFLYRLLAVDIQSAIGRYRNKNHQQHCGWNGDPATVLVMTRPLAIQGTDWLIQAMT